MRILLALALIGCGSTEPVEVAPVPALQVRPTVIADAAIVASPQSRCPTPSGTPREPHVVVGSGGDCWLRGTGVDEYLSEDAIAKLIGRPVGFHERTLVSFEITDRKQFDAAVRCRGGAPTINFRHDHVRMIIVRGEGLHANLPRMFDDGTETSLILRTDRRCGGAEFGYAVIATGVVVPADRKVTVTDCPYERHCTGMEK